jgi:hypothetical protein
MNTPNNKKPFQLILETLEDKACLKQKIYMQTIEVFNMFKNQGRVITQKMKEHMEKVDTSVAIDFIEKGDFEFHIKFGGDLLVFFMHTNIFNFEKSHPIWKTSYVKEDNNRSYCGLINIYNFLSDSFKFNRLNDLGYLVGRVFINKDYHFFVEGKRQLGFLYNDFVNAKIEEENTLSIIESSILYSLDFDLYTPPYDTMKEISVMDVIEVSNVMKVRTGKRLGFQFKADTDQIE